MKSVSMKLRLLIVVGVLSIVSFGMFGLMAKQSFDAVKNGKTLAVKTAAEDMLDKLDRNLFERYGDVQAFAMSEPARSGDKSRIVSFMADMIPAYAPIYRLMMVVNSKGKLVAVNEVDKDGKPLDTSSAYNNDYSKETWFLKAMSGELKDGTAFVEDLHVDKDVATIYKNKGHSMNFTAPIKDPKTGKIHGVWTNRVSWEDVVEQITKEQASAIKSDSIPVVLSYLMNPTGLFLLHPGGEEFVLSKSRDGFQEIVAGLSIGTVTTETNVTNQTFSGPVYEATAKSKGYSTYPGIGWIASVQVPTADPMKAHIVWYAATAVAIILLSIVFAFFVVNGLTKQFESVIRVLSTDAVELKVTADELNTSSQELASGATQQASSIQETASSIEEISSMVNKSADGASRAIQVAGTSQETASKGKETVVQMIKAIDQISESNKAVMSQFEQSNLQLSNIIKVISEIGSKTKVINDIVFQTKLLSFNASVEAARAGEHGKGFAVVAEEVGNLAQMSGNAAKEIGDMLTDSITKVQSIVDETKGKVEGLISDSRHSVEEGTKVAEECGLVLGEIVKNESEINLMINEISTASQEQATGVSEINKAIAELDKVTHQNTAVAQGTAGQADQITSRALRLATQVKVLEGIIRGSSKESQLDTPPTNLHTQSNVKPVKVKPAKDSNVVKFPQSKAQGTKKVTHSTPSALKTAVGAEEQLPSDNDPRFQEI